MDLCSMLCKIHCTLSVVSPMRSFCMLALMRAVVVLLQSFDGHGWLILSSPNVDFLSSRHSSTTDLILGTGFCILPLLLAVTEHVISELHTYTCTCMRSNVNGSEWLDTLIMAPRFVSLEIRCFSRVASCIFARRACWYLCCTMVVQC